MFVYCHAQSREESRAKPPAGKDMSGFVLALSVTASLYLAHHLYVLYVNYYAKLLHYSNNSSKEWHKSACK